MTPIFASDFLLTNGIELSLVVGGLGLIFALVLIRMVAGAPAGNDAMRAVAASIQEGAKAYLGRQIVTISIIAGVIFVLLLIWKGSWPTPVGFLVGAFFSMLAGYIGMRVAVLANVRTTEAAEKSMDKGLRVAFNGGAVTGLLVVGLALLSVGAFFFLMGGVGRAEETLESLVGLALGASLISVFARLGGGIYTKAADVGADLVGKIEVHLSEDDPRNPATIADNVGDNVGDCAGMAADVFETYAVTLIGALLIGMLQLEGNAAALVYPFVLGGISVATSALGIIYVNVRSGEPGRVLSEGVIVSAIISGALFYPATMQLFPQAVEIGGVSHSPLHLYFATLIGLAMTVAIVLITAYYTGTSYPPVRRIAKSSETGHATNIIAGLAEGNKATALPVVLIALAIFFSYQFGSLFGIGIAVMSMLSMAGIIISLDAFGPITDNAGGIAVMAKKPKGVREVTDALDAVGNTMKAVTKGYAIASAGVAALVLFGSYFLDLEKHLGVAVEFSLKDPRVIIGMLIGGLLPFLFTALSMSAVGKAAGTVVREVRRQLQEKPGIMEGKETPEYGRCVDIVTKAALREMIVPALLPVTVVVAVAAIPALGYVALGGVLMGTIVTGLFLALSMTSSGGAWDNAKKLIEDGHFGGVGSVAHAAAVTGDTVGDPYKDTSGPAINPMIKVVNILAILIITLFF